MGSVVEDLDVLEQRRADPNFPDAHHNLGLLFDALGKCDQAMTGLWVARKLYGRSAGA
jgi:hypothetical protein